MRLRKLLALTAVALITAVAGSLALAEVMTATIDAEGKVVRQSPIWIKQVEYSARPDYFSDYKVRFVPGVFKEVPTFCSVSVVDVRSNDNIYYGHAKLGSFPAINYVNVLTLKVGDDKPAGDSSMSFLLMCVK